METQTDSKIVCPALNPVRSFFFFNAVSLFIAFVVLKLIVPYKLMQTFRHNV